MTPAMQPAAETSPKSHKPKGQPSVTTAVRFGFYDAGRLSVSFDLRFRRPGWKSELTFVSWFSARIAPLWEEEKRDPSIALERKTNGKRQKITGNAGRRPKGSA